MNIKENYIKQAGRLVEYEMDLEGGDLTEEHAKAFISEFIESSKGEMGYPDAQRLFNQFIKNNEAEEHRDIIANAISDLCEKISQVK